MKTLLVTLSLALVGVCLLPMPVSPWTEAEFAAVYAQAPAAKMAASTPAVVAKAEPLPELVKLKVENLQLQADIAGRQLKASEAYLAYEAAMKKLGVEMDAILSEAKAQCFTVDQIARTRTPIVGCKAGK